ncbi:nitrite/sulfite reductase [Zooshikella harenae]|uniref:Nitrite/sulfite reductase n=1 Tax=Zooshikella harenae TaxID=2827238 RepID=A0ABS5ZAQ5_9GAMM|nr:nitrite/sulfite reductase [Zooshikella harenae]MBU2711143.1 nitrite/sulfite reductase [Zooshikella harenae]
MYKYDAYDKTIVAERVAQFRDQTQRYLEGKLTDAEFLPLRLQNGLYIQRFAPMLRVAIPYGMVSAKQIRKLAEISRQFDKGYVHFSTRQNVQYNWPKLEKVPDILAELATVEMHAIQTSGNCIRNTTTDQFAGVAADELVDPRPYCEIIRQWSTFHPEFAYLPRKFKIAINGAKQDRAAVQVHDIGLHAQQNDQGELGFRVLVGGGLGRTPMIGTEICDFLPERHLLTYLEAILRVYNRYGRRDNKYKARIKILVKALGADAFRAKVEAEWQHLKDGPQTLTEAEVTRISQHFSSPDYADLPVENTQLQQDLQQDPNFRHWYERNVTAHKVPGYAIATLSLKATAQAPGDASDQQLEAAADLAEQFSFGEIRVSHQQNLVLADVQQDHLYTLWQEALRFGFATPNIGLLTDVICCPGGDFCALANAKSLPIAEAIQRRFDDLDYLHDIGDLDLNISGCMNACGHHHVGHIGILGVDKKGAEFYQVQLGGSAYNDASLGKILGPSFARDVMPDVITSIIDVYLAHRTSEELFIDTYRRIGIQPFKDRVYASNN